MTESAQTGLPGGLRFRLLVICLAWGLFGAYLLLTTNPAVLAVGGNEVLGHFLLFMFATLAASALLLAYRNGRSSFLAVLVGGALAALISEVTQGALVASRAAEFSDFVADLAGVGVGLAIAWAASASSLSVVSCIKLMARASLAGLIVIVGVIGNAVFEVDKRLACSSSVSDVSTDGEAAAMPGTVLLDFDGTELATSDGVTTLEDWGDRPPTPDELRGMAFDGTSVVAAPPGTAESLQCGVFRNDQLLVLLVFEPVDLDQTGPARLFSVSAGTERSETDFHVGQQANGLSVRTRTSSGRLFTTIAEDMLSGEGRQFVIVAIDEGELRVFTATGAEHSEAVRGEALAGWNEEFFVTIGDEFNGGRGFEGSIDRVTVTNGTLTEAKAQSLLAQLAAADE